MTHIVVLIMWVLAFKFWHIDYVDEMYFLINASAFFYVNATTTDLTGLISSREEESDTLPEPSYLIRACVFGAVFAIVFYFEPYSKLYNIILCIKIITMYLLFLTLKYIIFIMIQKNED